MPGRFFLGVGTRDLNEHILGDRWPSTSERREMLEEAIDVMRLLWEGDLCSFEGKHYRVDDARLYTLPDEPIPVIVAAGGVEAAKLAARKGDGLVSTAPDAEIVSSYRDAGGSGATYGMLTVCWAASEEEARGRHSSGGQTPLSAVRWGRSFLCRATSRMPPRWSMRARSRRRSCAGRTPKLT